MILKRKVAIGQTWRGRALGEDGFMSFPFCWNEAYWNIGLESSKLVPVIEEQEKEIIFEEAGYIKEGALPTEPIYESDWEVKRVGVGR